MDKPWFDPETGMLKLGEYVSQMSSYQKILADNVVTREEIYNHAQQVTQLLRRLEGMLTSEAQKVATEALCELAVLYALERHQALRTP